MSGSTLKFTLEGTDEMISKLQRYAKEKKVQVRNALSSVVSEMANWIKVNHESLGGWINRTHALENSISHAVFEEGDSIIGVVYAGQDYAVYVEYKEGHWVISGAITEFKDRVMKMISERVEDQG